MRIMSNKSRSTVEDPRQTEVFQEASRGNKDALNQIFLRPDIVEVLLKIARKRARLFSRYDLYPTDLYANFWVKLTSAFSRPNPRRAFPNRKVFYGYSRRAMRNIAIQEVRRINRRPEANRFLTVGAIDRERIVLPEDDRARVREAIEKLERRSASLADIMRRRYVEGATEEEIANDLSMSRGMVRTRLKRGEEMLLKLLQRQRS
jgi:RNA polymerase sigma factor (sigma-70 family)